MPVITAWGERGIEGTGLWEKILKKESTMKKKIAVVARDGDPEAINGYSDKRVLREIRDDFEGKT